MSTTAVRAAPAVSARMPAVPGAAPRGAAGAGLKPVRGLAGRWRAARESRAQVEIVFCKPGGGDAGSIALGTGARRVRVEMPEWFRPFAYPGLGGPFRSIYGGRSASKTRTMGLYLVARALTSRVRVACLREFQRNMSESVKPVLADTIRGLDLAGRFNIGVDRITCPETGSEFFFQGLARNIEGLKGLERVNVAWIEEAQRLSHESASVLIPTLMRGESVPEMYFTWNPKRRSDWIWARTIKRARPDDMTIKVTYRDNPWFPKHSEREREAWKRDSPQSYDHVWEGNPDDGDASVSVLAYSVIESCVEAYRKGLHERATSGIRDIGQDIADGGEDLNAMVDRRGPVLLHAETWPSREAGVLMESARKVHDRALEVGAWQVVYDGGGVGSAIRGSYMGLAEECGGLPYGLEAESFGGAVEGGRVYYEVDRTNASMFSRRNIQMAWDLRIRGMNTLKLLKGEDVDPDLCLFISSEIPCLQRLIDDLATPQWRESPVTGKLELDKRGEGAKSPDLFDATSLAFSRGSSGGLTLRQ